MTVGDPIPLPTLPVEVDVLAKNHSVNSEEVEVKTESRNSKQEKNCLLAISTLACLLLLIVLVSVLLFIPFYGGSNIYAVSNSPSLNFKKKLLLTINLGRISYHLQR